MDKIGLLAEIDDMKCCGNCGVRSCKFNHIDYKCGKWVMDISYDKERREEDKLIEERTE